MATVNLIKNFSDEATCSLCLEYFKDPVTVDCGHNFCQACITQCLEKAGLSCPQCRQTVSQRNFRPNRPLANLVELIKNLQLEKQEDDKRGVCGKHQEPLKLFCKEDQMCICMVCDRSKEHKYHNVLPLDEASEEYKGKIKSQIASLEKKVEELEPLYSDEEQKFQKSLTLLETERQNGLSTFEQLQKVLEQNKRLWLSWLDDLREKKKENWRENTAELLNQITDLNSLIAEMEKKHHQPIGEFLQDIAQNLDRYNSAEERKLVLKPSQELDSSLRMFTRKREAFEKIFKDCQDSLEKALQNVYVTLDPDTAHPFLCIFEDQRRVTAGFNLRRLASNPERFDSMLCVLGCEKFTARRHYWDVEIKGDQGTCIVGVARESVKRKGNFQFTPNEGIWAIKCSLPPIFRPSFSFSAIPPVPLSVFPHSDSPYQLRKVRISLDYEAGSVAFSDACSGRSVFTFSPACFAGERVCPFFWISQGTTLDCC